MALPWLLVLHQVLAAIRLTDELNHLSIEDSDGINVDWRLAYQIVKRIAIRELSPPFSRTEIAAAEDEPPKKRLRRYYQ